MGAASMRAALMRAIVCDRLGDPSLTLFDAAGRPSRTVPLVGGSITEGGAVTGASAASCAGAAMGATSNVERLAAAAATSAVLSDRLGARVARVLGAAEADGAVDRADD